MSTRAVVYLGAFLGSIIGSYIPTLWGAGFLSLSSLLFSTIGGIVGIFIAAKYL